MKCRLPRPKPAGLNMTSMIDVIFLLLVFFVCTANFKPPEEVLPMESTLPGNAVAEVSLPDPIDLDQVFIQISFNQIPSWQVEGNQCTTLDDVQRILRTVWEIKPDIPVVIAAAENVPMEDVIDIYDVSRRVGLSQIQFSAD